MLSPYNSYTAGVAPNTYPNVSVDGTTWIDTPQFTGLGGSYGLVNAAGAVTRKYRGAIAGATGATQILGSLSDYSPT